MGNLKSIIHANIKKKKKIELKMCIYRSATEHKSCVLPIHPHAR